MLYSICKEGNHDYKMKGGGVREKMYVLPQVQFYTENGMVQVLIKNENTELFAHILVYFDKL